MQGCRCKVYPWWCQHTYLTVMQMSPCRDGDAKYLVVQMPSTGHVMMQTLLVGMSWCKCPFGACHDANVHLWVCHYANVYVGMSWCKCSLVGMSWCKCLFGSMPWCRMLWCKHNLFKNSFYFQNEASTTPETKIFQNLIYYSWKVIFFFDLRLLKNWWSLLEISEWGIDLKFDDLAQKIYFHNLVKQKGWHISEAFSWKNKFFENQAS